MASAPRVHRFSDPAQFRARAERWLLEREAEHNLLLGVIDRLEQGTGRYEPPVYLATVESERDGVVGCAFRTPPLKVGLTRMPDAAVDALVDDIARFYDAIPAVLGPERTCRRFAERWTTLRGGVARPGMRQGLYQLDRVVWPERPPPGRMRVAGTADLPLLIDWLTRFSEEALHPAEHMERIAADRIARGEMFLWDDDGPRTLVGWAGHTPAGVRIGPVYTPPEQRGRGYASACVAAASQRALDGGRRFCFLYTDLSNATSNSIYRRIGYRMVGEAVDYLIGEAKGA